MKLPFIGENKTLPDNYLLAKTRAGTLLKQLAISSLSPTPPVIRNNRETSNIRIVFDASAKFKNEKFLNDVLDPGQCLLPLLFNILLRFWTGKIGLIADIKQAFLQIEVAPEHRNFLRFMWFDDVFKIHSELISLRFTRVLFGLAAHFC